MPDTGTGRASKTGISRGEQLFLDIGPSAGYGILVAALHLAGMVAVLQYQIADWISPGLAITLLFALAVHGVVLLRRDAWLTAPDSVTGLRWQADGWRVQMGQGGWLEAELAGPVSVSQWFLCLAFSIRSATPSATTSSGSHARTRVRNRYVVIARDAVQPDAFRHASVILRLGELTRRKVV
ncbi:MAG: hypothetical protein O3B72_09550 [Proteobacteria bacterium]|nr:hypothetical protein [Pseudomonadota bacterium]